MIDSFRFLEPDQTKPPLIIKRTERNVREKGMDKGERVVSEEEVRGGGVCVTNYGRCI